MSEFDPQSLGATPVTSTPSTGFDPASLGATPLANSQTPTTVTTPAPTTTPTEGNPQGLPSPFSSEGQNNIMDSLNKVGKAIGSIFPGQKIGQDIGTLGGYALNAVKEKLGLAPKGSTAAYNLSAPSPLQAVGDVAKGAAMVGGFEAPVPATIAGNIGLGAGLSAVGGAGQAATQTSNSAIPTGQDLGQTAKGGLIGGVVGGAISGATSLLGHLLESTGNKIQMSAIKPSQADIKDGFSMDTIKKYDLGGSLSDVYNKTQAKMDELSQQLSEKLSQSSAPASDLGQSFLNNTKMQLESEGNTALANQIGKIDPSQITSHADIVDAVKNIPGAAENQTVQNWINTSKQLFDFNAEKATPVDLNQVLKNTQNMLDTNNLKSFGSNTSVSSAVDQLKNEISNISDDGKLSLVDAQTVKQAAGRMGAWQYGMNDPASTARETVYNAFYNQLKTAIENNSPEGVQRINKQLSELIPVNNAVIRRIPIAARNNALSLGDLITASASILNPKALVGLGASYAQNSGTIGNLLSKLAPVATSLSIPAASVGGSLAGSVISPSRGKPLAKSRL